MRSFLHKAKDAIHETLHDHSTPTQHTVQRQQVPMTSQDPNYCALPSAPTSNDVFRYRYQHGTNLGSIFVLEKWLSGSMFPSNATAQQSSELEAVKASVSAIGLNATRAKWEQHWQSAISDSDFSWLVNSASCTSIRLPVGYFTLGPHFCKSTPFEPYASVYTNAWSIVKSIVSSCHSHGIGVLLDLHALPGGANTGDHSGTNSGIAALWGNQANLDLATKCLAYMAQEIRNVPLDGVIGLQICNEAEYNAPGMYSWYDTVIAQTCSIDPSIPLYISDSWDLSQCISYTLGKNSSNSAAAATNPVIIDTHYYWAFSDANKAMSPQQIIADVSNKMTELDGKDGSIVDRGAVQVVVGEYSCVMDGSSWSKAGGGDRGELVKQFGNAQSNRWQQRAGGSFFWTYKMDWMPGGDWGFVQQCTPNTTPPPPPSPSPAVYPPWNLTLSPSDVSSRVSTAQSQQDNSRVVAVQQHTDYWNQTAPGQNFGHWRFEAGWKLGFSDAISFFSARSNSLLGPLLAGGDKIGCLEVWIHKRLGETGQVGDFLWEWEQGFRRGVSDFYGLAGV
ncbi:glycoside hydrolase [Rhizodiscina lignyota]|uniref:Glycoside hydrolase n=1 Tax=Rhizodiscina lignyota TaxID=1504668 RepID=A0A9P4IP38_9PEZI|nr:glycoside hydrolase [Rhizodiscina lignyota]